MFPTLITIGVVIFFFWWFYRIGYEDGRAYELDCERDRLIKEGERIKAEGELIKAQYERTRRKSVSLDLEDYQ